MKIKSSQIYILSLKTGSGLAKQAPNPFIFNQIDSADLHKPLFKIELQHIH